MTQEQEDKEYINFLIQAKNHWKDRLIFRMFNFDFNNTIVDIIITLNLLITEEKEEFYKNYGKQ